MHCTIKMRFLPFLPILTAAYSLITANPACRSIGPAYCPGPFTTNEYMSAIERAIFTVTNMARTRPTEYARSQNVTLACTAVSRRPFVYDAGLQQGAKQQSWLLEQRGCPFQHATCAQFCNLYPSCSFADRLITYVSPTWTGIGENIQMSSSRNVLTLVNNWLRSPGHCGAIYAAQSTHMGVGAVTNSYTQTFASFSTPTPMPSMVDGVHVLMAGRLHFVVSFTPSQTTAPVLTYNGTRHTMTRSATGWSVSFSTVPAVCVPYFFQTASQRLPTGTLMYATAGIGGCTRNVF